jgi:hypothetical protein
VDWAVLPSFGVRDVLWQLVTDFAAQGQLSADELASIREAVESSRIEETDSQVLQALSELDILLSGAIPETDMAA